MKKPKVKIDRALEKHQTQKQPSPRLRFSGFPENFVITSQEEKEGGFFGSQYSNLANFHNSNTSLRDFSH